MSHRINTGILLRVGILVLLLFAIIGNGCTSQAPKPAEAPKTGEAPKQAEAKSLTVGAILPLSGPISMVGLALGRGFELYFNKVNEQGGVKIGNDQYRINFVLEDGKGDADAAGTAANKLVNQDGAKFVYGEIMENATSAIYQITLPKKVLHLISWINIPGHAADIKPDKQLSFRPAISPHDAQVPLIDYVAKAYPNAKTIAISAPDIGYEGMIENLKALAKERGLQVGAVEKWTFGTEDFVPVYTKLLASNPDVIWVMVSGQAPSQVKTARDLGFKGVMVDDSPNDPDLHIRTSGPKGATDLITAGMDMSHPTDAMKDVMQRWKAKYGDDFVSDSLLSWDEAAVLVQGMEKAQSVEPEKVLATLESMTAPGSIQSVFGEAYIGGSKEFKTNRLLVRPISVVHVMNGQKELKGLVLPKDR